MLYRLHSYRLNPKVSKLEYFEEAFTSRNAMVRIYKVLKVSRKSKRFCQEKRGYPPALKATLDTMKPFSQIHGLEATGEWQPSAN